MFLRAMLALAFCASFAPAAMADLFFFRCDMNGLNEVPPNNSPGTGKALLTFDDTTSMLTLTSGTYQDLLANSVGAHVHIGQAGVNGPIIIHLTHSNSTSGVLTGSGPLNAQQITALFSAGLYINVHSTLFPGGEIRGQILAIPSPGAIALLPLSAWVTRPGRRRGG